MEEIARVEGYVTIKGEERDSHQGCGTIHSYLYDGCIPTFDEIM